MPEFCQYDNVRKVTMSPVAPPGVFWSAYGPGRCRGAGRRWSLTLFLTLSLCQCHSQTVTDSQSVSVIVTSSNSTFENFINLYISVGVFHIFVMYIAWIKIKNCPLLGFFFIKLQWCAVASGLERWLGRATGWSWPGLNPAAATSLRNFGNSVYPALPVSFGGDTKSRRSLTIWCLCHGK